MKIAIHQPNFFPYPGFFHKLINVDTLVLLDDVQFEFDLTNRIAIITGGAQGFGLAITERFIQSGAKVVIWDIDEEAAKKAIEDFAQATNDFDPRKELFSKAKK